MLIDGFLRGCRHSDADLRTSSLSSLATVIRLHAYQVHAFFQELIEVTQQIIVHDAHVTCRRAAVMLLAQLLGGFDDLKQFEEMLVPVYRAFRWVQQHESDETTLVHARLGLDQLKTKVTEFLTAVPPTPEIRIVGLNETPPTGGRRAHILEIVSDTSHTLEDMHLDE